MVSNGGEICWGGPDYWASEGISIPYCVAIDVFGGSVKLNLSWTNDQISIASPNGATLAVWSDYASDVSLTVYWPNGTVCNGRSFQAIPGDVTVVVNNPGGYAKLVQGAVSGGMPDCMANGGTVQPSPPAVQPPANLPAGPYIWFSAGNTVLAQTIILSNGSQCQLNSCLVINAPVSGWAYGVFTSIPPGQVFIYGASW